MPGKTPTPPAHAPLHASRRARAIDLALALLGAAAWISAALAGEPLRAVALVAASALTSTAILRSGCRGIARRTIEAATWSAEREREHAVADAARHSEQWRAIVDTATQGIVTIGENGIIRTVNGAALGLFGYTVDELVGRNVSCLMSEPYRSEHDGYLRRYLRTGERRIIGIGREVVAQRKDGTHFPIDLSVGEGSVDGHRFFTAVIRDLTERIELQTKLAQSERLAAVGELAAGVAHEVNNPINTVINCAQLIQDGDDPVRNSAVIIEEGQRIAEIVRDLLQFARDDRDKAQPTAVGDVVERTLRLIGENWKRHGVRLSVAVPDDLPQVHARPQQVQQVLLNLLINAKEALVHAGTQDRRVALRALASGQGVSIQVADNGPGIAPEVAGRIFEPFVTTKRARGGTGLGLSISKSIVEGYGGTLTVASAPGQGAEFTVWLPLAPTE